MRIFGYRAAVLNWAAGSGELSKESDLIPNPPLAQPYALPHKSPQEPSSSRFKLHSSTRYIVMPQAQPELKKVRVATYHDVLIPVLTTFRAKYLDKRLFVQLNGSRKVIGVLRGYDVSLPMPIAHLWLNRSCRGWQ